MTAVAELHDVPLLANVNSHKFGSLIQGRQVDSRWIAIALGCCTAMDA